MPLHPKECLRKKMKVLVCLLLICVSWASSASDVSCVCGWRNAGRVVGGKETGKNEYPWMVSLNVGCGGSIITEYHVLTAAHCTVGYIPTTIVASAGKHYKFIDDRYVQQRAVAYVYEHPSYYAPDPASPNDIAILVLQAPFEYNAYIGPVCLPTQRFDLVGRYIKVAGWGMTKGTGDESVLREVDIQVVSNAACKQSWEKLSNSPTQICCYTPGKNACNGDSGGPLVYLDPDTNRYTQVALVSYGHPDCGTYPKPSVNTDVFAFMTFIRNVITASRPQARICTKV